MAHAPSALAVALNCDLVSFWVATISALGTSAPFESVTTPVSRPVVVTWADTAIGRHNAKRKRTARGREFEIIVFLLIQVERFEATQDLSGSCVNAKSEARCNLAVYLKSDRVLPRFNYSRSAPYERANARVTREQMLSSEFA